MLNLRKAALVLGTAAALPMVLAATEAAANAGPNFCLGGSDASTCQMQIDMFNVGGNPPNYLASGYIKIEVDLLGTKELEFKLTSQTVNGVTYGFNNLFANFVAGMTGLSVSQVSATTRSGGTDTYGPVATGSFTADGWGQFNTKIPDTGNPSDPTVALDFTLSWTGSTSLADLLNDQFMLLNGDPGNGSVGGGQRFALEMIPFNSDGNLATGFGAWPSCQDQSVTDCVVINTPEPGSLAIIGGGLLGWAILRRRRAA